MMTAIFTFLSILGWTYHNFIKTKSYSPKMTQVWDRIVEHLKNQLVKVYYYVV